MGTDISQSNNEARLAINSLAAKHSVPRMLAAPRAKLGELACDRVITPCSRLTALEVVITVARARPSMVIYMHHLPAVQHGSGKSAGMMRGVAGTLRSSTMG